MPVPSLRGIVAGACLVALGATPVPSPEPSSSPTPNPLLSFSATGTASLDAVNGEKTALIQARLRFGRRLGLTRIDVLSVTVTANNGKGNITMPLPQGTVSAVFNQSRESVAVWTSLQPLYYGTKLRLSPLGAVRLPVGLSALTKYQVLSFSLHLVDHETIDGHGASLFAFDAQTQKTGGKPQETTGHLALADDLAGLPIHADLTVGAGSPETVSIEMDLTSISTSAPPVSAFAPPKGYKRTPQLMRVLMAMLPVPHRTPAP